MEAILLLTRDDDNHQENVNSKYINCENVKLKEIVLLNALPILIEK